MPRPRTDVEPEAPKVLDNALRILEAFGDETPVWSEAALRRHLSIPSTTLNRILRSLERAGYLIRSDDGHYQLGVAAIRLGNRANRSLNIAAALDSQLRDIARETGELAMLAVPEFPAGLARYVATADSASGLQVTAEVGSAVPITAGATAKAILAFQPQERIDLVLSRELRPLADGTPTDRAVIQGEMERIRRVGWAFSWEETYDGAWAVAAPLIDADKQTAFAALGVAAPTARYSRAAERAFRVAVVQGAARAVTALGYARSNGAAPPTRRYGSAPGAASVHRRTLDTG